MSSLSSALYAKCPWGGVGATRAHGLDVRVAGVVHACLHALRQRHAVDLLCGTADHHRSPRVNDHFAYSALHNKDTMRIKQLIMYTLHLKQ